MHLATATATKPEHMFFLKAAFISPSTLLYQSRVVEQSAEAVLVGSVLGHSSTAMSGGLKLASSRTYKHKAVLKTDLGNSPHLPSSLSVVRFFHVICLLPSQPHGLRSSTPSERCCTQVPDGHNLSIAYTLGRADCNHEQLLQFQGE